MPFEYASLIPAGVSILGQLFNRRSARREIPALSQFLGQSLGAQRDASLFARSAADPTSPWFSNLAAIEKESQLREVMRALRLADFTERRGMERGARVRSERSDEAKFSTWANALRGAHLASQKYAQQALLGASEGAARGMGRPEQTFDIFRQYGEAQERRRNAIAGGLTDILSKLYQGGVFGGGSTPTPYENMQRGFGGSPLEDIFARGVR